MVATPGVVSYHLCWPNAYQESYLLGLGINSGSSSGKACMQFEEQKVRLKIICDHCGTLVEQGSDCVCLAKTAAEAAAPETPQDVIDGIPLPQLGDRYDVLSLIGSGGMASVYKIYDKTLGKIFAAKVMRKDLALEPISLRRFADEAEAASAMTHGNIAAVYGHGVTNENTPYLFMDYLEGETLGDLLEREGKLDAQSASIIFQQICEALIHAHMKGIVHRDIKPSNIFITTNADGVQVVKLVDFGIAKLEYREEDSTQLTQTGALIGSPLYMSPEQCRGDEQDARSDIYAFGCVMYHALTGKPPFSGANSVKIVLQHVKGTAAPFAPSDDESGIANAFEECVMRCLEKDPSQRFQSAEQLLAQLQSLAYKGPNKLTMVEAKPAPWRRAFATIVDGAILMLLGHAIGSIFLHPALQADLLAQSSPMQLWCMSHYTDACAPSLSWSIPAFMMATLLFPAI
ncbi:MAG: serine/threonine protein kinase, partial [Candidatus Obscuribacterales bacterium]|nr:serine/threonine protein kinase [Candidatus Obscuribacterales bacterium]